jgi:hypothetical protein
MPSKGGLLMAQVVEMLVIACLTLVVVWVLAGKIPRL